MDSVELFLALLVAVAIGWLVGARMSGGRSAPRKPDWFPSPKDMSEGQSERFIRSLLTASPDDEDAMDFALRIGQSLRDKGESNRAIQFHQTLMARTDLPRSLLQQVELELALDYFQAGLNDRSEKLLLNLMGSGYEAIEVRALRTLVRLYEEEGEWQKILDLHQRPTLFLDETLQRSLAHAACELAVVALDNANYLQVRTLSRLALKIDRHCARAHVVLGDLAFRHQEPQEAIRCYLNALELDPNCLVALLDQLIVAFRSLGDDKSLYLHLKACLAETNYIPALLAMTEVQVPHRGFDAAAELYLETLAKQPSHYGFVAFLGVMARNDRQLNESQLRMAYDILRTLDAAESRFVCNRCGFEGRRFHWRCPSCKDWATLQPYTPRTPISSGYQKI